MSHVNQVINLKRLVLLSLAMLITACSSSDDNTPSTVLIINPLGPVLQDFVTGFTEGMDEVRSEEDATINYVYSEAPESMAPPAIQAAITDALTDEVDLVVCVSTLACTEAKTTLEERETPLLFLAVTDPIGVGLVTDFTETENVTGIASAAKNAANEGRAFEWLMQVAPDTETVFIPHNPADAATTVKVNTVQEVAEEMGVELVIFEVNEEADLDTALQSIPDNAEAIITFSERIFTVPFITQLNEIAIERGIPHLSFNTQYGQMLSYSPDSIAIGKQSAVLGNRILNGTSVTELPVEVPEFNLYINLPTVDAMNYEIDDQILRQAVVIRAEEG